MADNKPDTSIRDVTAMLTQRALARSPSEVEDQEPQQAAPSTAPQRAQSDQSDDQDVLDEDQLDEPEDDQEPEPTEDEPEDEGEDDDELDELDLTGDDQIFKVKVDGEIQEVSLRELKTAYSGTGAIQKRLKEATENRKAASNIRNQAVEEAEEVRQSLIHVIQSLDHVLHAPHVQKPDDQLKNSNPTRYLANLEAFNSDQERIKQARQVWLQLFQQQADKSKKVKDANRAEQITLLQDALPALKDKTKAKAVSTRIVNAATRYGFTDQELRQVNDSRIYVMAHDAERYHEIISTGKLDLTQLGKTTSTQRRTSMMKSGNTKQGVRKASQEKAVQTAKAAAQKSGKTSDVAAYLAAKHSQTRKPPNGRSR